MLQTTPAEGKFLFLQAGHTYLLSNGSNGLVTAQISNPPSSLNGTLPANPFSPVSPYVLVSGPQPAIEEDSALRLWQTPSFTHCASLKGMFTACCGRLEGVQHVLNNASQCWLWHVLCWFCGLQISRCISGCPCTPGYQSS